MAHDDARSTGIGLFGLKQEGATLLEPPGEPVSWPTGSHHACCPPLRFRLALARRPRTRTGELFAIRPAVHTARASLLLGRLKGRQPL